MTINGFYLTGMLDSETLYLIIDGYWDKKEILIHYYKDMEKLSLKDERLINKFK